MTPKRKMMQPSAGQRQRARSAQVVDELGGTQNEDSDVGRMRGSTTAVYVEEWDPPEGPNLGTGL